MCVLDAFMVRNAHGKPVPWGNIPPVDKTLQGHSKLGLQLRYMQRAVNLGVG